MQSHIRLAVRSIQRGSRRLRITFVLVALSVAALVVLNGLVAGVSEAMIRNAVAVHAGHVLAGWGPDDTPAADVLDRARSIPQVRSALRRTRRVGILRSPDGPLGYGTIYGVDPRAEAMETPIADKIVDGQYLKGPGEMVLGQDAAKELGLRVGQKVLFIDKRGRQRTYDLTGTFRTGIGEMDRLLGFTVMDDEPYDSGEISLFLASSDAAPAAADALRGFMPQYGASVQTWRELMPEALQLVALNRGTARVAMVVVLAILALGVANTMHVLVENRRREFGILKTLGMTPAGLSAFVLIETATVLIAAALLGTLLGFVATTIWRAAGGVDVSAWAGVERLFLRSGVVLPTVSAWGLALPGLVAVGCGVLAGLLPARRAGRVEALEAMR